MISFVSNTLVDIVMVIMIYTLGFVKGTKTQTSIDNMCFCGHKINMHKRSLLGRKYQGKCTVAVGNKGCACEGFFPKPITFEET